MARDEPRPVIKLRSTTGTGTARVLDTAGRVARFERRYGHREAR